MYGLKQAGTLTNKLLQKNLAIKGYGPTNLTAGLWKHKDWPTMFSLIVNDFGVEYEERVNAQLSSLR